MTNLELKELKTYLEEILLPEIQKQQNKWNDSGELYYVGGAVRDKYINEILDSKKIIKDIDLSTNLTPETIKNICLKMGVSTIDTGIEHGTVTLMIPMQIGRIPVEITTFRKDVATDGRNATIEYARTIEEDLSRRDFTFNAMAISLKDKILLDPFDGIKDIKNKNIKFVGSGKDRILEDHLRMIRMIRFAFQLNFSFEEDYFNKIKKYFDINVLSKERIKMELDKIIENLNKNNDKLLKYLFDENILYSEILYKDIFNNNIDIKILNIINEEENILKQDKLILKYFYLMKNISEPILIQKLKFSNLEYQKIKNVDKTINFFNNYQNNKIALKKSLNNKIDLNSIKNVSIIFDKINKTKYIKNLNDILKNKEPYNIKDLDINAEEIEYYLKLNLNGITFKKEYIGKCLNNLIHKVIFDKNINIKKFLIKEIENFLIEEKIIFNKSFNNEIGLNQ